MHLNSCLIQTHELLLNCKQYYSFAHFLSNFKTPSYYLASSFLTSIFKSNFIGYHVVVDIRIFKASQSFLSL